MNRVCSCLVAFAIFANTGRSDEKQDPPAKTPREQYEAVLRDYQSKFDEYRKAAVAAKTQEERAKAAKLAPNPTEFATKMSGLAERHSSDPVAVDALVWVVQQNRQGPLANEALAKLLKDHVRSDKIGAVCLSLSFLQSADAEKFLRSAIAESPHHDVKGYATFGLGQFLQRKMEMANVVLGQPELQARLTQIYGQEYADELKKLDPAKVNAEIEQLYERVAKDFADVKDSRGGQSNLAKQVEKELFEIRFLSIGKVAPDIEGEDIDGVKFKLSDYRGKVVVLDFWGDW